MLTDRHPRDPRLSSKPCQLALGKAAGVSLETPDSLLIRIFAGEIAHHLPVAESLHGTEVTPKSFRQELPRFANQSFRQLQLNPVLDPTIQRMPLSYQAEHQRRERPLIKGMPPVRVRERATAETMDLQCADDLHRVMWVQTACGIRIHGCQASVQMPRSLLSRLLFKLLANIPIGWWTRPQSPNQRPDIETRSSYHQGNAAFPMQPLDLDQCMPAVFPCIKGCVRFDKINQPVRHALTFL